MIRTLFKEMIIFCGAQTYERAYDTHSALSKLLPVCLYGS
ncbi:hypothetical protein T12_5396 [Trichinella patagoniensis]|uniref:Uncharacterized protein n=1 Tax=Trichinella patagoniensis TaxID=990121 RepID=A0A0V0YSM7_9BILA|nr:hypothetical protein T12_5396 [Trichinella patagoniensis]